MSTDDSLFLHATELAMGKEALEVEAEYLDLLEQHQAQGGLWGPEAERFGELRDALIAFRMFPPSEDWWQTEG